MAFIELKDVFMEYKLGRTLYPALRGVDLDVNKGEFIAIVGPSGSGKSTLIHVIAGISVPTRGTVRVDGVEISNKSDSWRVRWRRKNIGIVFQFLHLIPVLTVIENIIFPMELAGIPREIRKTRAIELLRFIGLEDKINRFPSELSGGEQQRVAIARALAADPPIILADEPTANLDSENKMKVMELLKKANDRGKTILYTTHDLEVAELADRILRLRDGRIEG
ncbi:MAG: ABC transporter ATP-binding protein [Desulfurococcales archaeon]|nr:ABC transporter ATP-binding protein [Desulfurococcales archaeon]MEB3780594.1 ABC transporter ATP-binding protein [Desulfurococcales archaeon]